METGVTENNNFYDEVVSKYGSWKNLIDSTSMRITGKIDYSKIDPEMHELIEALNVNELYTSQCCSGHGARSACVVFDTSVSIEKIISVLSHKERYTIVNETVHNLFGENCIYYRLNFDFDRMKQLFKKIM